MLQEKLNTYRQHFRQPELQHRQGSYIAEDYVKTCGGKNKIMPSFAIREDKKISRESYETYFTEKCKTGLNKRHNFIIATMGSTVCSTGISSDFLVWIFSVGGQFPQIFGRTARGSAETVHLRRISAPED